MPLPFPALFAKPVSTREQILVALGLIVLAALALRPSIRGNDGVGHYVYLASILRAGDLDFADDYRAYDALRQYDWRFADLPVNSRTGLASNRYGVGASIMWAPFVGVVHGALKAAGSPRANGLSGPYEWAVGIGTAFWAGLALWLLYGRLRRQWDPAVCLATLLGLIFATPLGFYMYAHGSMSHGVSFFAVTAAMLAFESAWRRPHHATSLAVLGFWLGMITIIRFQDVTWSLLPGLAMAARCLWTVSERPHRGFARRAGSVGWLALAGLVGVGPQLIAWHILYGTALSGPTPYLDGSAGAFLPYPAHLIDVLLSERGGVLAWHPLIALGLAGLAVLAWRKNPARGLARLGLAGFALQVLLIASWSFWWGGASFGNRFFISSLPFVALGVACWPAMARSRWERWGVLGLIGLLCLWNLGLLIQYATEMVPREDPVPWSQVIRQNLVDVPALLWEKVAG